MQFQLRNYNKHPGLQGLNFLGNIEEFNKLM